MPQVIFPDHRDQMENEKNGNGKLTHEIDGVAAGFQLEVSGDHEIIFNKLPEGWSLHHGNGTIIMHSMDGSRLIEKMLFEYVGDFHVESAIVGDWDGNSRFR